MSYSTTCRHCANTARKGDRYCSKCGHSLRIPPSKDWSYEVLKVADDADFRQFLNEVGTPLRDRGIIESVMQLNEDNAKLALMVLDEPQAQVLIRRFGLDGKAGRTWKQIAHECGVSTYRAKKTAVVAVRRLWHPSKHNEWIG